VTIDGEPNWTFNDGALRPGPKQYDFRRIDKVMAYAREHNKPVQMHHLVWGEEKWLPAWLKDGGYSPDQLMDLIHQHINTVAGHYRGQVREWTVVNEAFTRGQHVYGLRDWWGDRLGNRYIEQSFIWAHQADPGAKLLLNDFQSESPGPVSDAMYAAVKQMKARGVPIDGIGMQMHIDGTRPPNKEAVKRNMQRFGALGVQVYVTEFDVNMNDAPGNEMQKLQTEAQIYHDMASACIESEVCPSFALLGITDKESWYNDMGLTGAMPLPFDRAYQPKPAWYALRSAFSGN
jgi:endo-1,4-beta-xylanase